MDSRWFRKFKGEEADKDRRLMDIKRFLADDRIQDLREILVDEKHLSAPDYKEPNWAYRQAHENGFNQAVDMLLKLLND